MRFADSLNHFKTTKKQKTHNLENKMKVLETKLHNDENIKLYNTYKQELDEFFEIIA